MCVCLYVWVCIQIWQCFCCLPLLHARLPQASPLVAFYSAIGLITHTVTSGLGAWTQVLTNVQSKLYKLSCILSPGAQLFIIVCGKMRNMRRNLVQLWTEFAILFMEYHFWVMKWLTHELCWERFKSICQFKVTGGKYLLSILNSNFQINIRTLEKSYPLLWTW